MLKQITAAGSALGEAAEDLAAALLSKSKRSFSILHRPRTIWRIAEREKASAFDTAAPVRRTDITVSTGRRPASLAAQSRPAIRRLLYNSLMSRKLSAANPYMRDPAQRERAVIKSVATSSAIEGIRAPFRELSSPTGKFSSTEETASFRKPGVKRR